MLRATLGKCRSLCSDFRRRKDGQVAVIFGLAVLPIAGAIGAAIDYSRGNQVRASLQKALDAAVLAGTVDGSANWQQVALRAFNGNLNAKGSTVGTPAFSLDKSIFSGSVSATAETTFIRIMGMNALAIKATSAATQAKLPLCVLGLNTFDNGAFDMNGNSKFNAPDCAVQANTKSNKGMTQEGKPTAQARHFGVSGAHTGTGYSPTPKDGSTAVPDPYASMPFPSYTACENNPKGLTINGGAVTLSPGTYCGGVRIKSQATVTLESGIYVMVEGSLWLDGGATVNGNEVMVAFTGADATLRVWGDSSLNLTSPVSGPYKNFQFFQNPNDANGRGAWASIGGNGTTTDDKSKATWDGIAYFPTQNFWVFGNSTVSVNSPSLSLVVGQLWVQGNATLNVTNNNPRNLSVTQVSTTAGARLVQ